MDERIELERYFSADSIDRYLSSVEAELKYLPEQAEDWDPVNPTDSQDTYASEWASVAYGDMGRLEEAKQAGLMNATQSQRYVAIKELFKERLPLIERYSLDVPRVPLD